MDRRQGAAESHCLQNVRLVAGWASVLNVEPLVHAHHVELVLTVWIVGLVHWLSTLICLGTKGAPRLALAAALQISAAGCRSGERSNVRRIAVVGFTRGRHIVHGKGVVCHLYRVIAAIRPRPALDILLEGFLGFGFVFFADSSFPSLLRPGDEDYHHSDHAGENDESQEYPEKLHWRERH